MKRVLKYFAVSLLWSLCANAQSPDWQNQHIISENKQAPRASFITFNEVTDKYRLQDSQQYKLINGNWRFSWAKNPESKSSDFYKPKFDDSDWDNIPVPANWQLHGYGYPIYINHPYEFADKRAPFTEMKVPLPPFIPNDYNPVGSYLFLKLLPSGPERSNFRKNSHFFEVLNNRPLPGF